MPDWNFRALSISAAFLVATAMPACSTDQPAGDDWRVRVAAEDDIDGLARLYVELLLEHDPGYGMTYGIHGKGDDPSYYDDRLADVSPQAWDSRLEGYRFLADRLGTFDADTLEWDDQVDLRILRNNVALRTLQMTELGSTRDPLIYLSGGDSTLSGLGTAFSRLILRDYAPLEQRLRSFGARCTATPEFLGQTKQNLAPDDVRPTAVGKQVAVARLDGMIGDGGLFRKSLPELIAASALSEEESLAIRDACGGAVEALAGFKDWFEANLVPRADGEWRIGEVLYDAKYALYMDYPLSPAELLAAAESELERVGAELVATGRAIHDGYLAARIEAGTIRPAAELPDRQVVRNIFAEVAQDRSTSDSLIADSYALADAIVGFVQDKDLLDLPPTSKLRIEDIPAYLAGYAVAQIITAPPFEPELQSVWFWDLGLLATSDSFLKEYNRPTLAMVYIHEGVPGHFVQLEYSNRFERIAPKAFHNGATVEGWATYIATQLVDQGFTIYPDAPYGHEIQRMVDHKLVLRSIINAIIDIRLHTSDWSEDEAISLMMERGFQEEGEARGKLARAKQSSVQLASYFAGHRAILEILDEYREREGDEFSWKTFNERLVSAGSPPFFALRKRMLGEE